MRGKREGEDARAQQSGLQYAISKLERLGSVENMAIISLIRKGLKRSYGIAGVFFCALGNCFINIEMISQGASEFVPPLLAQVYKPQRERRLASPEHCRHGVIHLS